MEMFWKISLLCCIPLCVCSSVFNRNQDTDVYLPEPSEALMAKLNSIGDELAQLPEIIEETVDGSRQKYGVRTELLREMVEVLRYLKQKLDMPSIGQMLTGSGATYVRWGRTECPAVNGTRKVYDGFAAGGDHRHKGGSVELICLPRKPVWGPYDDGNSGGEYIYGTEIQISTSNSQNMFGKPAHDQNVPCVVCQSVGRIASLRIPGRTKCYDGWTAEYSGYLFAGHYNHEKSTDYTCLDSDPEFVQGSYLSNDGRLLYVVEASCSGNTLPCEPYHEGREIPCVICTQ